MKTFTEIGTEIGELVALKNAAYGSSFATAGEHLRILYPDGLRPEQYGDALLIVRILDKLTRIATDRDALGESPYGDIAGYGILGVHMHQRKASEQWKGTASAGQHAASSSETNQPDSAAQSASLSTTPKINETTAQRPTPEPSATASRTTSAPAPTATTSSASPSADGLLPEKTLESEFWRRVDKSGNCWLWKGHIDRVGCGTFDARQWTHKIEQAHRLSWRLEFGPIPKRGVIRQACGIRHCVRPEHLKLGEYSGPPIRRGNAVNTSKLSLEAAREIRRRHTAGDVTCEVLAKEFGVHPTTIGLVVRGHTWMEKP